MNICVCVGEEVMVVKGKVSGIFPCFNPPGQVTSQKVCNFYRKTNKHHNNIVEVIKDKLTIHPSLNRWGQTNFLMNCLPEYISFYKVKYLTFTHICL